MNKKIVIAASSKFEKEIGEWKNILEEKEYQVIKYPEKITGDFLPGYNVEFDRHYRKIQECDVLFVLNLEKNNIKGYIGPGVYAEIAFAIGLNKSLGKNIKVVCLNEIPDSLPHSEELKFWQQLGWITFWSKT